MSSDKEMKMNKEIVAERYDSYGEDFEFHCKKGGSDFHNIISKLLSDYILPDTTLLDVAGGDGFHLSELDSDQFTVVMTDLSQELLSVAKKRRPNVVETHVHDFDSEFSFDAERFDYTVCSGALEFASDLSFTIDEMIRVTKEGGVLLFTIDKFDPNYPIQSERIHVHDPKGFFSRRYTTEEHLRIPDLL